MRPVEIRGFTAKGKPHEIHATQDEKGYHVQVLKDGRPIGPRYSITFKDAADLDDFMHGWAGGSALEEIIEMAKRGVGWEPRGDA